jgi:hypothetical protein
MPIRYASTPQLHYGNPSRTDEVIRQIPRGARPMSEAPQNTSIAVMGDDGKAHWAMQHREAWQKLEPLRDSKTGAVRWQMNGSKVDNPICWWIPQRQRQR